MGYDDNECFECYHIGRGNNPCCNGDRDGKYLATCLTCIDNLCGNTSVRVTYALKHFDWDCQGRCTNCNKSGITISIPSCDSHVRQRIYLDDKASEELTDDCYLCNYEGKRNYTVDDDTENWEWTPYCDNCKLEIKDLFIERPDSNFEEWSGCGYSGGCSRCNTDGPVEELCFCNHHNLLIK